MDRPKPQDKKYEQTHDELMKHLKEQIGFLISSSKSFDDGDEAEAKRLTTSLRTLLHDTGNSKSLLGQLKKKDKMLFYDTASKFEPNALTSFCLCVIGITKLNEMYYIPRNLGDVSKCRKIKFHAWWEKQIVIADRHHSKFTRYDLVVRFVANQDGGDHVDPKLYDKYADLSRHNSIGWEIVNSKGKTYRNKIELSSIRQITHEVLKSLADEFPELSIEVPECHSLDESIGPMRLHAHHS